MGTKRNEHAGGSGAGGADTAGHGDWVQIHSILLSPEERSAKLPEDTRKVPLEMWVGGFLVNDRAEPGEEVEVETAVGRRVRGRLSSARPGYFHTFGATLPELRKIGRQLRTIMRSEAAADADRSEAAGDSGGGATKGGRA